MKEQIAESFAAEQPGKTVLLRLAFLLPQAGRASAPRVRAALAAFARACSLERLVRELARWEQALAVFAPAVPLASSQKWETPSVRAVLLAPASQRVVLERVFPLVWTRRGRPVAGLAHLQLAQRGGLRP
jgi:hypothetical protein